MVKQPVHLVVDTGVDDALALVAACLHPRLHLSGVTVTAGNTCLERAWANTTEVLGLLGADTVPVSVGSARRADGAAFDERGLHGPDGLGGLGPPTTPTVPAGGQAEIDPAVTLVCLAPMTPLLEMPATQVVASYARPGQANYELDPAAARLVRASWHVRDDVGRAALTEWPRGLASSPLAALVDGLVRHQLRRGAGLGDAEVVLRLAGVSDPVSQLWRLVWLRR